MASIKIAGLVGDSVVDGEGYRYTVFVQGCPHHCKGCHNPMTHSFQGGKIVDTDDILQEIEANPLLDGVTFSGGEPFSQVLPLVELAKKIKQISLNLWIYTGYTLEELKARKDKDTEALLSLTDVLVDGRFILEERDLSLAFRGSRNQRLIDMKKTRQKGQVTLLALN